MTLPPRPVKERTSIERAARAHRQRLYRARRRDGVRLLSIEVDPQLVAAMIARGWLSVAEATEPQLIAAAIYDLLDCWACETLQPALSAVSKRVRR